MQNQERLFSLVETGKIEGYSSVPVKVETVISRVFIFDKESIVLKFYKRDCEWWNKSMSDISEGKTRIDFITNDFSFNNFLNPEIYTSIKYAKITDEKVILTDEIENTDELVIVMKKEDLSSVFTDMLWQDKLSKKDMFDLGVQLANKKIAIPKKFLPTSNKNWYEQMQSRILDLKEWVESEKDFPLELGRKGVEYMTKITEQEKANFESIKNEDLAVLVDCNSENLIVKNSTLTFIDAFPPKNEWRSGTFDIDIYRVGSDIYASLGKEAFDEYIRGVKSVAEDKLTPHLENYHIIYASLIMSPYFYMLAKKNEKYLPIAKKYEQFMTYILTNLI